MCGHLLCIPSHQQAPIHPNLQNHQRVRVGLKTGTNRFGILVIIIHWEKNVYIYVK